MEVRTSKDEIEEFEPYRIVKQLLRETDITRYNAEEVAKAVAALLDKLQPSFLTTDFIRRLVDGELIARGLCAQQQQQQSIGIPAYDISNLVERGNRDNANMIHNPETVHKHVADTIMKKYSVEKVLPHYLADAHMKGEFHIHDLEFFYDRPWNCLQHDLRFFIQWGLKVDGTGDHTSVAGPPKHIETLMNHTGEIMLAAQQNMSGGQSVSLWNVFAAPFAAGLPQERIDQAVEMLIFNLNMAYAARGSQVPFTSINLEFTVPGFLQSEVAYGPKGKVVGVYGDFEDEVRSLQRAFTRALYEGDNWGKPHLFPNTIYALRKEMMNSEFEDDLYEVHRLSAKFGSPYFANMMTDYRGDVAHANYMGCRTCLNTNWTGDPLVDTLRTGNLAYVTINLPRIALETRDMNEFFELMSDRVKLAREALLLRREFAVKGLKDFKLASFLSQDGHDVKRPEYYALQNTTMSYGFVGLDEALNYITGKGLEDDDSRKLGLEILKELNLYAQASNEGLDEELRWTVLQSPAESTAHKFAMLDRRDFGDRAYAWGEGNGLYYTNSSHVPVSYDMNLVERALAEAPFHKLTAGGHIFHAFLGEAFPGAEGLSSLTQKFANNSELGLWAYSTAFSFCLKCKQMMKGLQNKCHFCGETENVEWYDRVTGYIQQVGRAKCASGGWNKGKRQELVDRY